MLSEIKQQPGALADMANWYCGEGEDLLKRVFGLYYKEQCNNIIFTGMGSSYFASQYAAHLMNEKKFHALRWNQENFYIMTLMDLMIKAC